MYQGVISTSASCMSGVSPPGVSPVGGIPSPLRSPGVAARSAENAAHVSHGDPANMGHCVPGGGAGRVRPYVARGIVLHEDLLSSVPGRGGLFVLAFLSFAHGRFLLLGIYFYPRVGHVQKDLFIFCFRKFA